jgi:colanic acid biosynthesis glycosyl transferase WcaI
MIKVGWFNALLYRVEAWSYRHAIVVSGISAGMLKAFDRKGVPKRKQLFFPNWIQLHSRNTYIIRSDTERVELGFRFREKFKIPEEVFLATYSGNLGRKQSLGTLVEAAALLFRTTACSQSLDMGLGDAADRASARPILILIIGDGVIRSQLEDRIAELQLLNVRMLPILVDRDYHGMLAASDVGLILQAAGTGQYFFPSKLLSLLSARVPIVSGADFDSELAKAIEDGKFGVNVPSENPGALAAALANLADNPEKLREMGQNTGWVDKFPGDKVLAEFERKLVEVTLGPEPP